MIYHKNYIQEKTIGGVYYYLFDVLAPMERVLFFYLSIWLKNKKRICQEEYFYDIMLQLDDIIYLILF